MAQHQHLKYAHEKRLAEEAVQKRLDENGAGTQEEATPKKSDDQRNLGDDQLGFGQGGGAGITD